MAQIKILLIVAASFPFYYLSLDIPKHIISDAIQGRAFSEARHTVTFGRVTVDIPFGLGKSFTLFQGIELDQKGYLLILSSVFLLLVLLNGGFKFWINLRKGALGERLLQRLRFDLFSSLLVAPPDAAQKLRPAEAATVIKDEVEPIGGFAGDAFVLPVFLMGQAITAILFIVAQNLVLGLIAVAMVAVQIAVVPRVRREQIRLGRQRQIASRALAGKVGEVVETLAEVANHGTATLERNLVARRLDELFGIRYKLYGHKFAAKTLNNLLAQVTPFLFYTIGGYAALSGKLEVGQLVAVIAAYRDLPPPVKELLDWDQQRVDVEAKFQQIAEQFSPIDSVPLSTDDVAIDMALPSLAVAQGLIVTGPGGDRLLDRVSLTLPLDRHIALMGPGPGPSSFARALAGCSAPSAGSLKIGPFSVGTIPSAIRGRRIAYVGPEPAIFDTTLRDNILYSIHHLEGEEFGSRSAADRSPLGQRLIATLHVVGLADTVCRLGLARRIVGRDASSIVSRIAEIRGIIRNRLASRDASEVIEPFESNAYIRNASIGENVLFGAPAGGVTSIVSLFGDPLFQRVLDENELVTDLTRIGQRLAATMIEIFADLSPDHALFDRFSFFEAGEFPLYRERIMRAEAGTLNADDMSRFIGLALSYIEPLHRLRLLDDNLRRRLLAARRSLREMATRSARHDISFYDADSYCRALPLRENLLFGAVAHGTARARERAEEVINETLAELGLDSELYALGLEHGAGHGGRLLLPMVKSQISLARSLIKCPDLLILDNAFANFGNKDKVEILQRVRMWMANAALVVAEREFESEKSFDLVVSFDGSKNLTLSGRAIQSDKAELDHVSTTVEGWDDVGLLQAVPLFAQLDIARVKLLAFTGERIVFDKSDVIFSRGDVSDSAYVIVSGTAKVLIGKTERILEAGSLFGELGVITGDVRSATIVAANTVTALRLEREIFLALLAEFPDMGLAITTLVVRRLHDSIAN